MFLAREKLVYTGGQNCLERTSLRKKNFPPDGVTLKAKSSSQPVNLPGG